MNHAASAIAEIVNRLELWFEQQGSVTDYVDVGFIYDATNGLWGSVSSPMQISQSLQKVGSPKLHTNDDGSMIRRGTIEQVMKYQIEYYFGDKNYYKDSFLQAFKTDGNPEGYVPVVELLRFSKMKRISPSLPTAELVQLIANVLSDSDVVSVHTDRTHLRKLSIEEGIIKKVEYFFIHTHLPYDTYIPISTIATLPKLQRYEYDFIERTLQKAKSTIFELSSDKFALRKKTSYKGALMVYHNTNPDHPITPPNHTDCTVEPLRLQVTKYIEYLFGDVNFPKDNFLLSKQNKEGFIALHEVMSFPRMRKLCTDRARVAEWLAHSDVVAWSEDMNFLRRKKPLPELRKIIYTQPQPGLDAIDESSQTFTVMTYNILADFLTTKFQFPYTTPETRNWEKRKNEILKEILFYQPDVVCLQEVQTGLPANGRAGEAESSAAPDSGENDHLAFFVANLVGYDYIYKRKTRYKAPQPIGPDIGNAIFFNTAKFSLVAKNEIEFERVLWTECKKDASMRAMIAQGHPQVAIFVTLNHIPSGNNVFIGTTHICSDYQTPYIQIRQVRACLAELQRCNKQKAPVVLAGDFNTQPNTAIYHFLAAGHVPKHLQKDLQSSMKSPRNVDYHHEIGLESAYAKVLGREPRCTNATHEFEGTLDYLWFTKKTLRPISVLDIPSLAYIKEEVGLPSKKFPSDHLPLFCTFKFNTTEKK